jgi:hypothetical protein
MRTSLILATLLAISALAAGGAGASEVRTHNGYFKTPSGNIQCDYGYPGKFTYVRCGIRSGLKPPPPTRGPNCSVPDRISLSPSGRPALSRSICPGEPEGDAGPFAGGQPGTPPVPVLRYGQSWSGGSLRCTSAFSGLTCRSRATGHGFFLSRRRWRVF